MRRYSSYKDSGVEWIGEIPSHWEETKHKFLIDVLSGYPFKSELFDPVEGFPIIRIRDITSGKIETFYTGEIIEDFIVKKGDLLVGMDGDFNIRLWDSEEGLLNQRCCSIKEGKGVLRGYLFYILPFELQIINDLTYFTTVKHLSVSDIKNSSTVTPPLSEQTQIVSYLERKTEGIDKLIQTKVRKIELLKEYRTSIISKVVTKGLNPNVEMKDSGVEWIGEIPRHWGTTRIKYTSKDDKYSFIDGDWIESKNLSDEGIRYITTGNIGEGKYKEQGKGYISEETFEELNCTEIFEGDLIISRLSLPVGRSCVLPYIHHKVVTSVDNVILRPKEEFDKYYLNYLFNSPKYFEYTELISRGVTLTRISRGMLGNNPIVFPPLSEQEEIVSYLDEQTQLIDKNIQTEERKIELLKEFRQSLISEVVTGKIKVCNDEEVH